MNFFKNKCLQKKYAITMVEAQSYTRDKNYTDSEAEMDTHTHARECVTREI